HDAARLDISGDAFGWLLALGFAFGFRRRGRCRRLLLVEGELAVSGPHLDAALSTISEAPTLNPLPTRGPPRMPGGPHWGDSVEEVCFEVLRRRESAVAIMFVSGTSVQV